MAEVQPDGANEARNALTEIVAEYGPEALSSSARLSNVLKDVLPDDPRMSRMLLAAAEDGVADALRQHLAQGMEAATACAMVTSSFAASTMFAPEACAFVVEEFAVALGLKSGTDDASSPTVPAASEIVSDAATVMAPTPVIGGLTWRRPLMVSAAGVAAVVLVVVILLATGVIGGPSYPRSWCGPVMAQLTGSGGTEQTLLSGLQRAQRQDHAPVGSLLNDLYAYEAARVAVEDGSNLDALSNLADERAAINVVGSDLRTINRECGQPSGAYKHDNI